MKAEERREKLVLFFHFLSSTVKCQILQMPGSEYKKLNVGNTNEALLQMKKVPLVINSKKIYNWTFCYNVIKLRFYITFYLFIYFCFYVIFLL